MNGKKIFYGWWIVVGGFFLNFAGIGIAINSLSVFFKPVIEELHFSRGDFSLYFTIAALVMMAAAPFAGKLLEKYNIRVVMTVCTVLSAVSVALYAKCNTLSQFYLVSVLLGIGMAGSHIIPVSMMVSNWFLEKRGLAMGIAFSASGLGGLIFNPVANWFILQYGWRSAYIMLGIVMAVTMIPTAIFIVRARPEEMGLRPYGEAPPQAAQSHAHAEGLTLMEAFKTGAFWLAALLFLFTSTVSMSIQQQLVPYLTDIGHSSTTAANILGLAMGILILAKILVGEICDRAGLKAGLILVLFLIILANAALFGAQVLWIAVTAAVFYGFAQTIQTIIPPLLTAACVGLKHFGVIYGFMNIFITLGSGLGMPLAGYIYDRTGSYHPAFWLYIGLTAVSVLFGWMALSRAGNRFQGKPV